MPELTSTQSNAASLSGLAVAGYGGVRFARYRSAERIRAGSLAQAQGNLATATSDRNRLSGVLRSANAADQRVGAAIAGNRRAIRTNSAGMYPGWRKDVANQQSANWQRLADQSGRGVAASPRSTARFTAADTHSRSLNASHAANQELAGQNRKLKALRTDLAGEIDRGGQTLKRVEARVGEATTRVGELKAPSKIAIRNKRLGIGLGAGGLGLAAMGRAMRSRKQTVSYPGVYA